MKIFNNNLKSSKLIRLNKKLGDSGKKKHLPGFSKEWKNTIYCYNKNTLKNIPANNVNINKIIKNYFNLYFKNKEFLDINISNSRKLRSLSRHKLLRRIYVSDAEIKHTNSKATITLYTVNRERKVLTRKYLNINKRITKRLIRVYYSLFKNNILKIYNTITKCRMSYIYKENLFNKEVLTKNKFLKSKLLYLFWLISTKRLYSKKVWSIILNKYSLTYLNKLRKFKLLYSLNHYKFNRAILLPKLSSILNKIIGKKIEYNIVNLKSIVYNTDLFTNALALKLRKVKMNYLQSMFSILNRVNLPVINTITERTPIKFKNFFLNNYKDLKIISHLGTTQGSQDNLDKLLNKSTTDGNTSNTTNNIHNVIYESIGYKNIGGIRLEVKGRLTKRYRADRSINFVRWKGGLKNIDSSFKRLSSVLFRGNTNSNTAYSLATGKRRIGSFAVKGWISGK